MSALAGLRVVEFASVIAGPYAGFLLAELGAEVIKVEPPGGDVTRRLPPLHRGVSAGFYSLNRGKRSTVVDLRSPGGHEVARKLIATADVVIENWRPGVAQRLGLGCDDLRTHHPRLVTVSIRGFGETGPYAHDRAYDSIVQAISGMAAVQGGDDGPQFIRTALVDKIVGMSAVQGVLATLLTRGRTGRGGHVQVNMLDAALAFLWPDALSALTFPDPDSPGPREQRVGFLLQAGDGGWLTISAVSDGEWSALCETIGRRDLADSHRTIERRQADGRRLVDEISAFARRHTRGDILAQLRSADVPSAPVNQLDELLDDAQIAESETITAVQVPGLGKVRVPPSLVSVDGCSGREPVPASPLGGDTAVVLAELGYRQDEVRSLHADGAVGWRQDEASGAGVGRPPLRGRPSEGQR